MVLRGEFCKIFIAFVIETKIFSLEVFMKIKTSKLLVVLCLVATMVLALVPMFALTTSAAETEIVFNLGANGSASHADGSSKTTYSETNGDYTLSLTGGTNMYTGARDAKGNSCIKLGASSKAGGFSFTVPSDVTRVIIEVAKYKANTTKVSVGGTTYTISGASNNGAYDAIEVDTTSTKTVKLTTVSGGYRAMVNTITYIVESGDPECDHTNTTTSPIGEAKDATCTENGITAGEKCECGHVITEQETIPALGHKNVGEGVVTPPTCTEAGYTTYTCERCGEYTADEVRANGHSYENGKCTECGELQPLEATLTFNNTSKRTEFTSSKQVWEENGIILTNNKGSSTNSVADYAQPARFYKDSTLTISGASKITKIEFTCNTSEYATNLKNSIGDSANVSSKVVTVTFANAVEEFSVKLTGGQVRMDSLKVYFEAPAASTEITHASVNAGEDLSLLYYVTGLAEDADAKMVFTMNGATVTAWADVVNDETVFILKGIAPQQMNDVINATLYVDDEEVATYNDFSIKAYADKVLEQYGDDESLVNFVNAMLAYGTAAENYAEGNEPETAVDVTDVEAPASDRTTVLADGATFDANLTFTSFGVRFDYVNKVYFKLVNTNDADITVKIDGVEATVVDGVVYTDAIKATEFGKVFTAELYVDGELYQTVTYSVNSYIAAKWNSTNLANRELARAMYLYSLAANELA